MSFFLPPPDIHVWVKPNTGLASPKPRLVPVTEVNIHSIPRVGQSLSTESLLKLLLKYLKSQGWQDGSVGESVCVTKLDDVGLIPRVYRVYRKNRLPQTVLDSPHICHGMYRDTHITHTHNKSVSTVFFLTQEDKKCQDCTGKEIHVC